ncbi:hypothetical protein ACE6H2_006701 [Prunus campanulata]
MMLASVEQCHNSIVIVTFYIILFIFFKYRARRNSTYTHMELDEVREELATHVLEWLFD